MAGVLWQFFNAKRMKFSLPLKRAVTTMFSCEDWIELERDKDRPREEMEGLSYRQMQILFSERFMKPMFGPDIFGKLAVRAIRHVTHQHPIVVFSDCGFDNEGNYLAQTFSPDHVYVVRLHRDGSDFRYDSRSYIYPALIKEDHQYDFFNNFPKQVSKNLFAHWVRVKLGLEPVQELPTMSIQMIEVVCGHQHPEKTA